MGASLAAQMVILTAGLGAPDHASRLAELARLEYDAPPAPARAPAPAADAPRQAPPARPPAHDTDPPPQDAGPASDADLPGSIPFGEKGSLRWNITGGGAIDMTESDNRFYLLGGGVSYFLIDDLSVVLEMNLMYFDQLGDDAFAANINVLARWHFLARETWSLYADGGAGFLLATDIVPGPSPEEPRGGNHFEFTPQFGGGVSIELDERTRLVAGARWHHISNARTRASNPPRDSVLFYVGASLEF